MSKNVKELIVKDLSTRFGGISEAVMIDCGGLNAEDSRVLRAHLRSQGLSMDVVKNTLIRRVLHGSGLEFSKQALRGPTALVWGGADAIVASKAIAEWRRKNKRELKLKGGILAGKPLDDVRTEQLSRMPGAQEIRAMVVGAVAGPLIGMVSVVNNTLCALPRVLQAIVDKKNAEGA
ncbi:MAG: 50S ribosomal protein L10 [Planctomycetes bacterium]|nr:50S ribosomal protein L10 [Planctomycetota bacterium]